MSGGWFESSLECGYKTSMSSKRQTKKTRADGWKVDREKEGYEFKSE